MRFPHIDLLWIVSDWQKNISWLFLNKIIWFKKTTKQLKMTTPVSIYSSDLYTFLVYVPFYAPLCADRPEQNYFSLNWFCFSEIQLKQKPLQRQETKWNGWFLSCTLQILFVWSTPIKVSSWSPYFRLPCLQLWPLWLRRSRHVTCRPIVPIEVSYSSAPFSKL